METELSSASVYTEFSGLSKLKLAAKNESPEALEEVANQFEAFFLNMMLKQMRDSSLADGIFDSDQSKFYQGMMDQQLSLSLAKQHTVGIADSIVRQLEHTVNNTEKPDSLKPLPKRVNFEQTMLKLSPDVALKQSQFQTPAEFINTMRPYAEEAAKELGVPVNILLAQSALETGWGQKVIRQSNGESSHNLFGIKADESWSGERVKIASLEFADGIAKHEVSEFRAYNSFKESFDDYVNFIKSDNRYRDALAKGDDGKQYIQSLQNAGYATDPQYANKIINILERESI